jgi:hypothetical protein
MSYKTSTHPDWLIPHMYHDTLKDTKTGESVSTARFDYDSHGREKAAERNVQKMADKKAK